MYCLNDNDYPKVNKYIKRNLKPVTISIAPLNNVSAIEMINSGELKGWCWQSTTFLSIFLDNLDVVSRGNITLPGHRYSDYFHSWIEFIHSNEEYVFDPALNDLRKKIDYYKEFNAKLEGQVLVERIRTSLIELIENSQDKSVYIPGTNNIEDPFFRTNSKIVGEVKNNKIKKLDVRFYHNG